jgi:UPF0755 protein
VRKPGFVFGTLCVLLATIAAYLHWDENGLVQIEQETTVIVPSGSTITAVAKDLEDRGILSSAEAFIVYTKIFGGSKPIQAGEFLLTPEMDLGDILGTFQTGKVKRYFLTIPEGMPSILVHQRIMEEELLTGTIDIPTEGSVLPDTYDFERGESRAALLDRMQLAMTDYLLSSWAERADNVAVSTVRDAVILASIVEKETGISSERGMVAGLYSNRLRIGMRLQADPTIIYPITKGAPLGRRIRRSEIDSVNDYNTYTMSGLPKGPITNPGRDSISAVLNPSETTALFMVADGSGGHAFAATNKEHEQNVAAWRAFREQQGQ